MLKIFLLIDFFNFISISSSFIFQKCNFANDIIFFNSESESEVHKNDTLNNFSLERKITPKSCWDGCWTIISYIFFGDQSESEVQKMSAIPNWFCARENFQGCINVVSSDSDAAVKNTLKYYDLRILIFLIYEW